MKKRIMQYLKRSVSRRRFFAGLGAVGVTSLTASSLKYGKAQDGVQPGDGPLPPQVDALMHALAAAFKAHGGTGDNYVVIRGIISSEVVTDANGKAKTIKLTMGSANTCCYWRWDGGSGTLVCEANC